MAANRFAGLPRLKMAQALVGPQENPLAGSPAAFDSQGLQTPPEVTQAIMAMLMPAAVAPRLMARGSASRAPAMAMADDALPIVAEGARTGNPHAIYAYSDDFGPEFTKRSIYNVFGDPSHPLIKQAGWGSSLPAETIKKFGIPITGRRAQEIATASHFN